MGRKTPVMEWGDKTVVDLSSSVLVDEDDPCPNAPDCKFKAKAVRKSKAKGKTDKPFGGNRKGSTPPLARSPVESSADKGKDVAVPSPSNHPKGKGIGERMEGYDEDRSFLVRVRPGEVEAEVLFLNKLREGWEGPFDLRTPLQSILEYDVLRVPRKSKVREERTSPDPGEKGSDKGESKSEEKTPPAKIGKAGNSPL